MGSPGKRLRCLIVDDSEPFVQAATSVLEHDGLAIVGTAATIAEALRGVEELRPDVTLVDIYLGDESGFELAVLLDRDGWPFRTVVILTSTHDHQEFQEMVAASPAVGFVPKDNLSGAKIRDLIASSHA